MAGTQSRAPEKMLLLKDSVSREFTAASTQLGEIKTVGSMPIYDEKGRLLGYIPLFKNANLK